MIAFFSSFPILGIRLFERSAGLTWVYFLCSWLYVKITKFFDGEMTFHDSEVGFLDFTGNAVVLSHLIGKLIKWKETL